MNGPFLLLTDPSSCLRRLALQELFGRSEEDPEVRELIGMQEKDALVADLLAFQEPDGSWKSGDGAWSGQGGQEKTTALSLTRLGYLGIDPQQPAVRRGAKFLFSRQREDGAWPLPGQEEGTEEHDGYSMIPLQTALPLRGLAACGYATDPRAERAYEWLLAQRLPDGAWPTGIAAGNYGGVAGYRRLAHSRWGCRSNTTAALSCLAQHPERRQSPEAQRALDLLLGRETREQHTLGFEMARLVGAEPLRGFLTFFARFDLAFILDLCWRVGANRDDGRVAEMVTCVQEWQGPYGLWEYSAHPQTSRWITFDLLRSLTRLDDGTDWLSLEPRTPFQAYDKRVRRF